MVAPEASMLQNEIAMLLTHSRIAHSATPDHRGDFWHVHRR